MTTPEARRAFEAGYDREPTVVASAPGRVNLVGGHTDYNDGLVLPMAIDHRTTVAVSPRDDETIRMRSTAFDGEVVVDSLPAEPLADEDQSWANYPLGVLVELVETGLVAEQGLDLLVAGDVPRGAGLSSSAALEVATAAAVYAVSHPDDDLPKRDLAEACWRAETDFVGLNCGIMDQYASALCRKSEVLFIDCRSRETTGVPFDDEGYRVVVVDTRVEHELASSAYNERVRECEEAVARLDRKLGGVNSLRDVDRGDFAAHAADLPGALRRRARHVITENERVQTASSALRDGEIDAVGDCMFESHASLRDDYEVSCDELDTVVELAWETDGVVGARMTGGGFGGSVVALVERDAVEDFRAHIDAEYTERAGVDVEPRTFVCSPAAGVRIDVP